MLLLLYLLCRRFPPLGDGIGFLCTLVARLLVKLQWFAEAAAQPFAQFALGSLLYPPGVTNEAWFGLYVVARIVLFLICAIVLTGEPFECWALHKLKTQAISRFCQQRWG